MMLPVRLASISGLPLKSVGAREQVSLFPALSSRPKCRIGSEACGGRSDSLFITSRLSVMASRLMSLSRGSCAYNTVYSVFKASVKNLRKVSFTNRRFQGRFVGCFEKNDEIFFFASLMLSEMLEWTVPSCWAMSSTSSPST